MNEIPKLWLPLKISRELKSARITSQQLISIKVTILQRTRVVIYRLMFMLEFRPLMF